MPENEKYKCKKARLNSPQDCFDVYGLWSCLAIKLICVNTEEPLPNTQANTHTSTLANTNKTKKNTGLWSRQLAIKWICVNAGEPGPPAWLEATRVVSAITDPPPTDTVSYAVQPTDTVSSLHSNALSCILLHCSALLLPIKWSGPPPRIPARNLIIK